MLREDEDPDGCPMLRADRLRGTKALVGVGRRHPDVHDRDVREVLARRTKEVVGVADLSDHLETRVGHDACDAFTHEHRVVGKDEPQEYHRSDRSQRTAPILELIFHELESEWALEIVRGVEQVAGRHHMAVVLSELHGRRTPGRGWIEGALARHPTGVIAVFSDLSESVRTQLRTRGIPFVVVDPTGEPIHDTPSIGAANWNGGLAATRHLLGLGHRRIAVVGGPDWILCSRARMDGYRAAMDAAGVAVDPDLSSHGEFQVEEGVRRGRALLGRADRPTAIITGNDLQALGVYQAAREARLHIPEDLSVVGFDDLPVARWVGPPLTTIRQPLFEMAVAAAELVLALARGEQPIQTRLEFATDLVVRESTAPPAA